MALGIGIRSAREKNLLLNLANGTKFEDLGFEEKMIVYHSKVDIQPVVEEESLQEFEKQMTLNNAANDDKMLRKLIKPLADRLRGRLE